MLLRLNPNDNQGVRYTISGLYAGISGSKINDMMDEGNAMQNWDKLHNLVKQQNAIHKFWKGPKNMKTKYFQVLISAENKKQANKILDSLLKEKLVIGGLIIEAPAKFWWKGKIVKMPYCNILTFTIERHKKKITTEVRKASVEEVPMIAFSPFEGNREFLNWIDGVLE